MSLIFRSVSLGSILCVLSSACEYRVILGDPEAVDAPHLAADGLRDSKDAALPSESAAPREQPSMMPSTADAGTLAMPSPTPMPSPGRDEPCNERIIARGVPCDDDPDPCGL